jgi:hypothetical protein
MFLDQAMVKGFSKVTPHLGRLGKVFTPRRLAMAVVVITAALAAAHRIRRIREM